jgi:hypothetical protein
LAVHRVIPSYLAVPCPGAVGSYQAEEAVKHLEKAPEQDTQEVEPFREVEPYHEADPCQEADPYVVEPCPEADPYLVEPYRKADPCPEAHPLGCSFAQDTYQEAETFQADQGAAAVHGHLRSTSHKANTLRRDLGEAVGGVVQTWST